MKFKAEANIHNRFVIEVRDKETNELKQKGVAENIILDRAYTKVCNFQSYFNNIHFGKGTGTLSPSRTSLFSWLGQKAATIDSSENAYPISKVTKKITLNPEEFTGQTITEVGISETSSNSGVMNTHALIKDAEGNPLGIVKTSLDVVIIYATVFIEFANKSINFRFTNFPNNNLANYFINQNSPESVIESGFSPRLSESNVGQLALAKSATRTVDVPNKKVTYSTRFGIEESNGNLAEVGLKRILGLLFPEVGIYTGAYKTDLLLEIGNGTKVQFSITDYNVSDLVVKVNGNIVTDYTITDDKLFYTKSLDPLAYANRLATFADCSLSPDGQYIGTVVKYGSGGATYYLTSVGYCPAGQDYIRLLTKTDYISYNRHFTASNIGNYLRCQFDYPSISEYYKLENGTFTLVDVSSLPDGITFSRIIKVGDRELVNGGVSGVSLKDYQGITNTIVFGTPPAEGDIITADYFVDYIPKTSDYILDVAFEISFNEGV